MLFRSETIAFTVPMFDGRGAFLGAVTTRVGIPNVEEVTTRTIRELERKAGSEGLVEYQMVTRGGKVFVDSDLEHKGNINLLQMGLPSVIASRSGKPGFVAEEHLRRHVPVVTGYASTKGYGDWSGFGCWIGCASCYTKPYS